MTKRTGEGRCEKMSLRPSLSIRECCGVKKRGFCVAQLYLQVHLENRSGHESTDSVLA